MREGPLGRGLGRLGLGGIWKPGERSGRDLGGSWGEPRSLGGGQRGPGASGALEGQFLLLRLHPDSKGP